MRSARTSTAWTFAGSSLAQLDLRGYGRFDVNHIAAPDVRCGWGNPRDAGLGNGYFLAKFRIYRAIKCLSGASLLEGLSGCSNFISCAGYRAERLQDGRARNANRPKWRVCTQALERRASNRPLTTRFASSRRTCMAGRPSCPSPIRSDWRCWSSTNWKNSQCWIDSGVLPTYWGCASYRR